MLHLKCCGRYDLHRRALNPNISGTGRDPVRDNLESTRARFNLLRNIEIRPHELIAGCHSHGAVIMSARIEHVVGCLIGDPNERIVLRGLELVPVRRRLRQTIELEPPDPVRRAGLQVFLDPSDDRLPGIGLPR